MEKGNKQSRISTIAKKDTMEKHWKKHTSKQKHTSTHKKTLIPDTRSWLPPKAKSQKATKSQKPPPKSKSHQKPRKAKSHRKPKATKIRKAQKPKAAKSQKPKATKSKIFLGANREPKSHINIRFWNVFCLSFKGFLKGYPRGVSCKSLCLGSS